MKNAHLLITNDDGIFADGIQYLAQSLYEDDNQYRLSVFAPDRERSAVGHAITMHKPLRVEKVTLFNNPDLIGWSVNGTPSDSVKLALEAILDNKPDMVLSGINRGSNLGTDVLYSGTVSAAVEGLIMGIPSIAISLTGKGNSESYNFTASLIKSMIPRLLDQQFPASTLININVPVDVERIKGVRVTHLGTRRYCNAFDKRIDPRGMTYYWLAGELVDEDEKQPDSDTKAIKEGYVSITPIHFQLTNEQIIPELTRLVKDLPLL